MQGPKLRQAGSLMIVPLGRSRQGSLVLLKVVPFLQVTTTCSVPFMRRCVQGGTLASHGSPDAAYVLLGRQRPSAAQAAVSTTVRLAVNEHGSSALVKFVPLLQAMLTKIDALTRVLLQLTSACCCCVALTTPTLPLGGVVDPASGLRGLSTPYSSEYKSSQFVPSALVPFSHGSYTSPGGVQPASVSSTAGTGGGSCCSLRAVN